MARLESEAKGGYYPTPAIEIEYILNRLTVKQGANISLLDPCCGEGTTLHQWQQSMETKGANPISYGIEIEKSRAEIAEHKIDHLIKCGYEEARLSHDAFSALYLNPPFMEVNGNRAETTFLIDLTQDYLQPGGLLIFNIPIYVLRDCAKILASRFVDIQVYRFSDMNYDAYSQIIIFARRRPKGLRSQKDREYQQHIEKELYNQSFLGKEAFPSLDSKDWDTVQFEIPTQMKPVELFQSMKVEVEDIVGSSKACKFDEKVESKMLDLTLTSSQREIRPAMKLKYTHIATAIAAGALPESMGDHLLVGVTKRVTEQKEQLNPKNGKMQDVTTLKPKSIVRVFSHKGIFNLK